MKICPECNNQVKDDATFCDNCGLIFKPLGQDTFAQAASPNPFGEPGRMTDLGAYAQPTPIPGKCSACGFENEPGDIFCQNCGLQLAPISTPADTGDQPSPKAEVPAGTCAACGYLNVAGEMFCQNCGVQLAPVGSKPPPPPTLVDYQKTPPPATPGATSPCPACGTINPSGGTFCQNCGLQLAPVTGASPPSPEPEKEPLPTGLGHMTVPPEPAMPTSSESGRMTVECPSCGQINQPSDVFCQNCGLQLAPMTTTPPPSGPAPIGGGKPAQAEPPEPGPAPISSQPGPGSVGEGICLECGHANPPGEMFCENCGVQLAPVTKVSPSDRPSPVEGVKPAPPQPEPLPTPSVMGTCPACGLQNPADEVYCQNCGFKLESSAPEPDSAVLERVTAPTAPEAVPPPPEKEEQFIECSNCGHQNSAIAKFCQMCGTPLPSPGELGGMTVEAESSKYETAPMQPDLPSLEIGISGKLVLRSIQGVPPEKEVEIPIAQPGKDEITIGRLDPDKAILPDIDLTAYGGETGGVSRLHARLALQEGKLYIEDLNSTNFTYLNKQKLVGGQKVPLNDGDEIRLGAVVMIYYIQ